MLPPLLPRIIDTLQITSTQAGFALTLMWGLYSLCQYPSGRLSDHLSRKTLLVSGSVLLGFGFGIVWATVSYPMFLTGVAVVGLGAGLYPTAARALISDLFVARRGQAFGVHTAAGDLGNAAAAGLAAGAVAFMTWQAAFLPMTVLFGGLLIVLHLWSREPYVFNRVDLELRSTGRRLFATSQVRWLLVAYILFAFTWQSFTGFLPTFLQVEKGLSVGLASTGFAMFFIVGMAVKPVAGLLGDRLGRTRVAVGGLLVGLSGLVSLLLASSTLIVFFGIGIFAVGLMSFPPVMQAFFMDIFPDRSMGGDLGGIRTIYIGIGSIGPTYVGFAAGIQSYTTAFAGLVVCVFLSMVILILQETI
jgi:MFS family permease